MKKTGVTLVDVANKAGVSVMTASRALSGEGYASTSTKLKVQEAAKALGYAPNVLARVMKRGKTNIVGIVAPNLQDRDVTNFITAVTIELRQIGMDVLIYPAPGEAQAHEIRDAHSLLHSFCEGLIVGWLGSSDDELADLERSAKPTVLVNPVNRATSLPVVIGEGMHAKAAAALVAQRAVEVLIEAIRNAKAKN